MAVEPGAIVTGEVTRITNFGVFVKLENGKTGLVHISQVSRDYVEDISEVLSAGETVKVKVRSIEGDRIDLSIKDALEPTEGGTQAPPRGARRRRRTDSDFEGKMKRFLKESEQKLADARRQKEARGKQRKKR